MKNARSFSTLFAYTELVLHFILLYTETLNVFLQIYQGGGNFRWSIRNSHLFARDRVQSTQPNSMNILLMLKNYALFIPVSPWVMLATFLRSWYAVSQTSGIAAAS